LSKMRDDNEASTIDLFLHVAGANLGGGPAKARLTATPCEKSRPSRTP
jgi:hypothetical protein